MRAPRLDPRTLVEGLLLIGIFAAGYAAMLLVAHGMQAGWW
ncbi:hypothetical protein [Gordonibacter sp. An230]|nr:hypothetical protein [Gordonibacter sp. An230]